MKEPWVSVSLRLSRELWTSIYSLVESQQCTDFSQAMRNLMEGGLMLIEIKNDINNPQKVQELANSWNTKMNEKEIFDWASNLSDNEMKAVHGAIELEKEKRYHKL